MKELAAKYFKGDRVIWTVIMLLLIVSMLAVYSSTGTLAYHYKDGNTAYYFFRHTVFLLVGLFITYVVHKVPYRLYIGISQVVYLIAVVLLIFTLLLGVTKNEATRWLTVPGLGIEFQTSDFAKIALIILVSKILSQNQQSKESLKVAFRSIMMATGIVCILILPTNFSTTALIFGTIWVLMFVGRVDWKYLMGLVGIAIVAFGIFVGVVLSSGNTGRVGTWKARIESFASGESGENYQAEQSKIAISTGGFLGKGPGNSMQRNILPHPYSDFIYSIIVEEYGAVGGFGVMFLYLILLYRAGIIVKKSSRTFPALLAMGLTMSMVFQALINIGVAVNLIPVTGQTLPLVSMGGTSIFFTSAAFGIILSISRNPENQEKEEAEPIEEIEILPKKYPFIPG